MDDATIMELSPAIVSILQQQDTNMIAAVQAGEICRLKSAAERLVLQGPPNSCSSLFWFLACVYSTPPCTPPNSLGISRVSLVLPLFSVRAGTRDQRLAPGVFNATAVGPTSAYNTKLATPRWFLPAAVVTYRCR